MDIREEISVSLNEQVALLSRLILTMQTDRPTRQAMADALTAAVVTATHSGLHREDIEKIMTAAFEVVDAATQMRKEIGK